MRKIESAAFVASCIGFGALLGAAGGVFLASFDNGDFIEVAYAGAGGALIGFCVWLGTITSVYNMRHRQLRYRRRRQELGMRSPWGEVRTEAAKPFSSRLSSFVESTPEDSAPDSTEQPEAYSSGKYWSLVDMPRDVNEPKPAWFIRRILVRIRQTVLGSTSV